MSESVLIALLAALGAVAAATISVSSGRRLKRLEAVSNILKDLPADDEARAVLLAVRLEDAVELRREQQSTFTFFVGTSFAALALSVVLSTYGEALQQWSVQGYLVLAIMFLFAALLLILSYIAIAAGYSVRWYRKIRSWARARRAPDTETQIEDAAAGE